MTQKQLDQKVERLGGFVEYPAGIIKLPKNIVLKTKEEALNLLDVLQGSWDIEGEAFQLDDEFTPYTSLKNFIKKGTA